MNTYLPYCDYHKTASVLETSDLLRQRRNAERLLQHILFKLGKMRPDPKTNAEKLEGNPIFSFWWNGGKPYALALYRYWDALNWEAFNRKERTSSIELIKKIVEENRHLLFSGEPFTPRRITTGYRIVLLCKNTSFYKERFYRTYLKNKELIAKLKKSDERYKFSKLLGLVK